MAARENVHEEFMARYESDPDFHQEVDRLMAGEVDALRRTLGRITALRREDFASGFHYEKAVRYEADYALRRLT